MEVEGEENAGGEGEGLVGDDGEDAMLDLLSDADEDDEGEDEKVEGEDELLSEVDEDLDSLQYDSEEEDEVEVVKKEPLKFFGNVDELPSDDKQARLLAALKKRNFAEEQAMYPIPEMTTKYFDLSLPEARRLNLLAQFPSTMTMRRYERPYTPVALEVITEFQETELPNIGSVRKMKREKPPKEEIKKAVQIIMPPEEVVANPFFYPEDIPAFMKAQEEERLKKREENLNVPCKEKLHGTALIQQEVARRVKPYVTANTESVNYDPLYDTITWEASRALNITRIQKVSRKLHANYSKHRKDVFYTEYGIHARHKAIRQLREQVEAEEVALKNYEYLSNYAAESLDAFLRESEDAKNQASKVAEEKLKENIVLTEKSRSLNLEASSMKTDIAALNESLRECKYYMQFLDNVAKELTRRNEEKAMADRQKQDDEDLANFLLEGMSLEEAEEALREKRQMESGDEEEDESGSENEDKGSEGQDVIQYLKESVDVQDLRPVMASRVNSIINMLSASVTQAHEDGFDQAALLEELNLVEGDARTDDEELAGLVFSQPSQLLDIYVNVEEQNLALIQHAQRNEEAVEGLERRIRESRKVSEQKSRRLRDTINDLEAQMEKTNEQIESLTLLLNMFTGGYYDVKSQDKLIKLIRKHVNKLYKTCIGSNDSHLSSVLMLTSIEKNFEDIVRDLDSIPSEVVLKISRGLEKERREAERREQESIRSQNKSRIQEARLRAPVKQKKGRSMNFRSRPPKPTATLGQKQLETKAENDDWNYYFGE